MATSVSLTRSTRDTISSLRTAIEQADEASQRISTGKRVNEAIDDPAAYFTSQSLSQGAAELDKILEDLTQGIQVVKAADNGMTAIKKLIDAGKALINRANDSTNAFDRAKFAKGWNDLLDNMESIAADSSYRGKNILAGQGHDLKLYVSDARNEAIRVEAVDFTNIEIGLGLSRLEPGTIGRAEVKLSNGGTPLGADDKLVSDTGNFTAGDVLTVKNAAGTTLTSITVTASMTMRDLAKSLDLADKGVRAEILDGGAFRIEAATDITITGGTVGGGFENMAIDATESGWYNASATENTTENVKDAEEMLRLRSVTFGSNLTLLQGRERFVRQFSGTLISGSESLVAADINEEGALLLSLNMRQQFSANALSFAREADQGVLRLLGG